MTTGPVSDGPGEHRAEVIPLRAGGARTEVDLQTTEPPAYADVTSQGAGARLPVIPGPWRRENIAGTVGHLAGLYWHRARYHGLRLPAYLLRTVFYAVRGSFRLAGRVLSWWHWTDGWVLESQAVAAGRAGHLDAMNAHREGKKTRGMRGRIVGVTAAVILAALLAMIRFAPWWGWLLLAAAVIPPLARAGRPRGKPIIAPAVVAPRFEPLTPEVITRALGALGIAAINQAIAKDPAGAIEFKAPVTRDGPGWRADVDLPHGVTAAEIMDRRDKLASGLRRQLGCMWPETDHGAHPGRLILWVGDEDMAKARQPAWPLAKAGGADLFRPVGFGTDQRGRLVTVTLMFVSVIIGAIPRMGKTFLLRLLLLIAALDVRAELHAYDLKGTGDLSALEPVAHRYRAGDEDEDIAYLVAGFRALRAELRRRTKVIRGLPRHQCPENKVTPELASQKSLRLHPVVIGVDECQVMFEHPRYGAELEEICTDLVKRGPAVGMVLILATQRPDAKSLPTGISANAALRLCLKVMGQTENDMVLGTSAYKTGVRATMFAFEDKGICYFAGEGQAPRIVRAFGLDALAAEKAAARARIMREHAGTLSGYALGLDDQEQPRSFAADVLAVFGDAAKLWCETIAARLAGSIPGTYAGITQEAVASQLRALGVEIKNVREPGRPPRKGCDRAAVQAAAETADA